MKPLLIAVLLVLTSFASAKDKPWETARVVLAQGSIPARGVYWLRGAEKTYVIHNYANGSMIQWWVNLTIGGTAKIYSDGRNLHVVDDRNKERKCAILQAMTNEVADAYLHREAAKTPEQLLTEQKERDAMQVQQEAFRQQQLQRLHESLQSTQKPSGPIKPLPATPAGTINCSTNHIGDTAYTTCTH